MEPGYLVRGAVGRDLCHGVGLTRVYLENRSVVIRYNAWIGGGAATDAWGATSCLNGYVASHPSCRWSMMRAAQCGQ